MSKFKVGDRVRIVCQEKKTCYGKEATIWLVHLTHWEEFDRVGTGYFVDIDGIGKSGEENVDYAYEEHELEPLVPPDELAWQKFREHLKPNPLVIFDADPITVSTEHEAEAIADRVPNSHIIVAVYRNGKRIVLSEYYGQSQSNRP